MQITEVELKSNFLQNVMEEDAYKSKVKALEDWLTGQTSQAMQQYQATAQTAAEQASYDISGAYANYLKQQRNIASQGRLESGHKEELSGVLGEQYESAYSQARAEQAQTTGAAQATYAKNVASFAESASKTATSYYESAIKEAEKRAKLYKAAEEYAGFSDESLFPLYEMEGDSYQLTQYGLDVMSSKLLGESEGFKNYLESKGLTDELEYYLSDAQGLHKSMFGITDTAYDELSESSIQRRLSAVADVAGEKVYYVDTIQAPELDVNWNDFSNWDVGVTGHRKMLDMSTEVSNWAKEQLGLSDDEIKQAFGYDLKTYKNVSANEILEMELAEAAHYLKTLDTKDRDAEKEYNKIIGQLKSSAKTKYVKE